MSNDTLISSTVVNQSYSDKSMWISMAVQVAYGTDLDMALAILREAAIHPRVQTALAPAAYVSAFADSGIEMPFPPRVVKIVKDDAPLARHAPARQTVAV